MSVEKFRVRNKIIYKSADDCFFIHLVDDNDEKVLINGKESWQLVKRSPINVPEEKVIDAIRHFMQEKELSVSFIIDEANQNSPEIVHQLFKALEIPLKTNSVPSSDGSFNRLTCHGDIKFRFLELCKKNVQALEGKNKKTLSMHYVIFFSQASKQVVTEYKLFSV